MIFPGQLEAVVLEGRHRNAHPVLDVFEFVAGNAQRPQRQATGANDQDFHTSCDTIENKRSVKFQLFSIIIIKLLRIHDTGQKCLNKTCMRFYDFCCKKKHSLAIPNRTKKKKLFCVGRNVVGIEFLTHGY